jgi:hypothetical protein
LGLHAANRGLTPVGDDHGVWKPLAAALLSALALAAAAGGEALPGGWTHAEINYTDASRTAHTLILDRGRVVAVSTSSLTLREADGTSAPIVLTPSTAVVVNGRPAQLTDIRRGMTAVTQRIDGGAAVSVRAHGRVRLR